MDDVTKNDKIRKMIEMIHSDISGIDFYSEDIEYARTYRINYEPEKNNYYIDYFTNEKDDPSRELSRQSRKEGLSLDEIITFLNLNSLASQIDSKYEARINKEKRYSDAKNKMLETLNSMENISIEHRVLMEYIIDKTTQLPEIVGTGNRINIVDEPDYNEHLRLADNTRWDDKGELHLQLVKKMSFNGMTFRDYPILGFEEIVNYVATKNLLTPTDQITK